MLRRIVLAAMMFTVTLGVMAVISALPAVAQTAPSASRSFDSSSVDPGGQVVVTITASGYGAAGGVTETLPDGFSYVSSSLDAAQVSALAGNQVRFTLQGDTSFTYTVTASSTPGSYTFSGTLRDANRDDRAVGGVSAITVNPISGASASRSFRPATVDPGERIEVTITASNYGQAGGVTETLPDGFSYVSSSLDAAQVSALAGNQVRFTLQGDSSFTYTVTASSTPGSYTFSGMLRDADRNDFTVGGASDVTIAGFGIVPVDASRAFSSSTVAPGATVTVTIAASNYGQAGGVTETLPDGFLYVSSSLDAAQVSALAGNQVRFTLQGDTSFTYTVTASNTPGSYTFSGMLRDEDRNDHEVRGANAVTVRRPSSGGGGSSRVVPPPPPPESSFNRVIVTDNAYIEAPGNADLKHNVSNLIVAMAGGVVTANFLDVYNATGGLERWGYPTSEVVELETGSLTQFFQRGVLDFHDVGAGYIVERRLAWDYVGGGLGGSTDQGVEAAPDSGPAGGQQIGAFGHYVANVDASGNATGFLDFFNRLGGVDSFGFPKTEARADTGAAGTLAEPGTTAGFTRQYFQAAVFQLASDGTVQLTLLGDTLRNLLVPDFADTDGFGPADALDVGENVSPPVIS